MKDKWDAIQITLLLILIIFGIVRMKITNIITLSEVVFIALWSLVLGSYIHRLVLGDEE